MKAQGAALTLKKLADDASWAEMTKGGYTLKRFEGNIPDIETDHKLDVLFEKVENGVTKKRLIEMKNWSVARSITGTTYDQFKQYITSGNDFIYYFSDASRGGMKGKLDDCFKNNTSDLWNANSQYFKDKNLKIPSTGQIVQNINQFNKFINEITPSNSFYDFIK